MKLWILGLSVCLCAPSRLPAQSADDYMNAPARVALGRTGQRSAAISLQQLEHQTNKRALQLSKKGMGEYSRGRYQEALSLLQQAAALDEGSSMIENNLGVVYCLVGKDGEAQRAFEQAISADPSNAVSCTNLASVAFNTHQYRLAEMSARQALRAAPLFSDARVMLALAEVAQGHWTNEARRMLEENRWRRSQAAEVLEHWPAAVSNTTASRTGNPASDDASTTVLVRGAGAGAFARAAR